MKAIFLFLLGWLLYSCSTDYKNDLSGSTNTFITEFPITLSIEAENLEIEIPGIHEIYSLDDYFIGVNYTGSNKFLHVYDKKDFTLLTSLISRGRGPDEFLTMKYINQWGKDSEGVYTWIADINSNKLCKLNLCKSIELNELVFNEYINSIDMSQVYDIFVVDDSLVCLTPMISKEIGQNEVQFFNLKDSNICKTHQLYKKDFNKCINEQIYQIKSIIRPDKTMMVAFGNTFSRFHIFNLDFSKVNTYTVYNDISEKSVNIALNEREISDLKRHYTNFIATNEVIFGLYANKYSEDIHSNKANGGMEIHMFNWKGAALTKILIKENIWQITIDEKEKVLYGITANEQMYRYDLSGIL